MTRYFSLAFLFPRYFPTYDALVLTIHMREVFLRSMQPHTHHRVTGLPLCHLKSRRLMLGCPVSEGSTCPQPGRTSSCPSQPAGPTAHSQVLTMKSNQLGGSTSSSRGSWRSPFDVCFNFVANWPNHRKF